MTKTGVAVRGTVLPWARALLGLSLSALSAVLLILAFPPFNFWFLAWFAFLPMILSQYRIMPKRLSSLASAVAIGGWGWGVFGPIFAGSGSYMQYLPLAIFVLTLLFDSGLRRFHEQTRYRWFLAQGVANWVGFEMIRGFIPIAGTWGFIAYTQHTQPWLIQPVSIFSIYGLSSLILLLNYALGLGVLNVFDSYWLFDDEESRLPPRLLKQGFWLSGLALVLWLGLSLSMFRSPQTATVRVAAIQPEIATLHHQSDAGLLDQTYQRMLEQSRKAAAQGAELIVWPEGALLFDPQVDDRLDFKAFTAETGAYLVLGYVVNLAEGGFRNEATVLSPEGAFLGVFGKDHPVVFGGETSPTRGTYPVYDTSLGRLGTIICYDLDFTDTARKLARQGAKLIAVPSQDWPAIARKHYAHLVFRAVENRVAMVKADGGFDSAIIDAQGRVLELSANPTSHEATLVADLRLGTANSLSVRLGDWIGWLNLAAFAFFAFLPSILARRAKANP